MSRGWKNESERHKLSASRVSTKQSLNSYSADDREMDESIIKADEQRIQEKLEQINNIALRIVEARARKMMREDTNLTEFVMAMGVAFFITKNGDNLRLDEVGDNKLDEFINEWDDELKITGQPMRFTVRGKVVKDW